VILNGITIMNTCSQYNISAFGDCNVYEDLKRFKVSPDGNARLNLTHYMMRNIE